MKILELMELLSVQSDESRLGEDFWNEYGQYAEELGKRLSITSSQAVILSICLRIGPHDVDYDGIANHLDISNIKAMSLCGDDINALVHTKLLKFHDVEDEDSVDIPRSVIKALMNNHAPEKPIRTGLNQYELFKLIRELFDDLFSSSIKPRDVYAELQDLFMSNKELPFVRELNTLELTSETDWMVLILLCNLLVNKDDDSITYWQIRCAYRFDSEFNHAKAAFQNGSHPLMKRKLVEHECEDGGVNPSRIHLSNTAKLRLLADFHIQKSGAIIGGLVNPENITKKSLFYPDMTYRQVHELLSFLTPDSYKQIHERMEKIGFRNGFTCLFYGPPGTGKTETVYQIAKKTGRSLMIVDVPAIKSKWVGDSEKNIKAVFDRYRMAVQRSKQAPILLFNEADAIFGIRTRGSESSIDKMENTIQDIILQDMENLDGILIATTNLTQNLDIAFERRFLYKIRFDHPDASVRELIWKAMLPSLTKEDCSALASVYDLSGGQIENIARKFTISTILHGDAESPLNVLQCYCKEEKLDNRPSGKIGFVH